MIKINLGCGWRNFGDDWYHIDGGDYKHLDSHDIFNIPFENNTVDVIYASHVIEYFDIATTVNANDFGDLLVAARVIHGASDSHGGLTQ